MLSIAQLLASPTLRNGAVAIGVAAIGVGALDAAPALAQSFSTNFDGSEFPLSEGGAWHHQGLDWTRVRKQGGIAHGTQTGFDGYDDSYAYLSGFPPNQRGAGIIQRTSGSSGIHEVEILLRWNDGPHSATGYECLLSYDASYAQIVRWNGPLGDFTYIGWAPVAPFPATGDTFAAEIVGDHIVAYYNDAPIMEAHDSTWTSGNPGVGFYYQSTGSLSDMAFTSFTAVGLSASGVEPASLVAPVRWLGAPEPNPFRERTRLRFLTSSPSAFSVRLFDCAGREVKVGGRRPVGRRAVARARWARAERRAVLRATRIERRAVGRATGAPSLKWHDPIRDSSSLRSDPASG
ncbi:MAG: hypothetical protein U0527_14925 [Candidatus Eisenbacteria bacterium]